MQSSRVRLLVALLVVMATGLYLARSLRWVPADRQEVVRQGRETVAVLGPGVHLLPVGARERIRYPAGEWTYVFPAEEDFRVLDARSLDTEVGLRTTLRIPEGSAEEIRRLLGADMEAALELTLQRLVSRHAASVPAEADRASLERLAAEVSRTVGEILAPTGIEVTGCEVTRWVPLGEGGAGPLDLTLASERPLRRVVLVGVDGADWTIIDPLIEAGKLPNFARLRREGATGDLRSFEPLLSPLLWTTMATGKLPEEHGVLDFNVTDPATGEEVPVNRLHRRVDAMWNVLSDYGRSVAVIGWLATHPPEPVDGIVISDRLGLIAQGHVAARRLDVTDVVQPASRAEMVESALVRHPDLQYSDVRAFADVDEDLFRRSRDLEPGADRLLSNFLSLYAAARTYQGVTMELLEQSSFDFLTVYQDFVDASCHLFMPAAPPRREEVSDEEFARYRGAVEAVYREQDRMLGEVMARCGEGTLLMIVSDHGFKSGSARLRGGAQTWTGKAPLWHRLEGVVAFWGDGVRPGARLEDAELVDVTPTVLALAGLPRAEDMPGRILIEAFVSDLADRLPSSSVPTHERRRAHESVEWAEDPAVSEEITRKLQALGYISVGGEGGHRNLAERYQEKGEFEQAIVEYRKALEDEPGDHTLLNNLAICMEKTGKLEEAERTYLAALELAPDDVYAMNNLAVFYLGQRQPAAALPWAQRAVELEPSYANAHLTLGSAHGMLGRLDAAEAEFRRVLELDPDDQRARANLQRIERARGRAGGDR